jgi:hypothetical protein
MPDWAEVGLHPMVQSAAANECESPFHRSITLTTSQQQLTKKTHTQEINAMKKNLTSILALSSLFMLANCTTVEQSPPPPRAPTVTTTTTEETVLRRPTGAILETQTTRTY